MHQYEQNIFSVNVCVCMCVEEIFIKYSISYYEWMKEREGKINIKIKH